MAITEKMNYGYEYSLREHNTFKEEYYGGSDVFLLVNGKKLNDTSSVSFSVREQAKPIYGHSSRVFDDIAIGARIVQGILRVPVSVRNKEFDIDTDVSEIKDIINSHLENKTEVDIPDWVYDFAGDEDDEDEEGLVSVHDFLKAEIKNIQLALVPLGYMTLAEATGQLNANTRLAIRDYKIDNGMSNDSVIDKELIRALLGNIYYIFINKVNLKFMPGEESDTVGTFPIGTRVLLQGINDALTYGRFKHESTDTTGWTKETNVRREK